MKALKRLCASAAIIFILALLGAMAFEATQSQHSCIGDDCPVCAVLSICDNILSLTSSAGGAVQSTAAAVVCAAVIYVCAKAYKRASTLVTLKAELDC